MRKLSILTVGVLLAGWATAQPEPPDRTPQEPIPQDRFTIPPAQILALHEELDADPERWSKVAASLLPLRDRKGRTEAYIVHIKSDADTFAYFGLENGDIVRKINSMPMTEPKRWKYIVDEVVAGRIRAHVVEIERGGETRRLTHMFREPQEEDSNNRIERDSGKAAEDGGPTGAVHP